MRRVVPRGAGRPVVLAAAYAVLLAGCTTGAPDSGRPGAGGSPSGPPETLATYDTAGVAVARAPFCDRVSPTGIERALGGTASSHRDHGNGDRIRLPDGTPTRAHEYGCEWQGSDGTAARAWVFVPPVAAGRARQLASEAQAGCEPYGTGEFGRPSVGVECDAAGDDVERSWRGLFGDAWLVCTLTGAPDVASEERTSEWCVAALEAARA